MAQELYSWANGQRRAQLATIDRAGGWDTSVSLASCRAAVAVHGDNRIGRCIDVVTDIESQRGSNAVHNRFGLLIHLIRKGL
jgi:hypothetical protein